MDAISGDGRIEDGEQGGGFGGILKARGRWRDRGREKSFEKVLTNRCRHAKMNKVDTGS